jgi:hypothetical protein
MGAGGWRRMRNSINAARKRVAMMGTGFRMLLMKSQIRMSDWLGIVETDGFGILRLFYAEGGAVGEEEDFNHELHE